MKVEVALKACVGGKIGPRVFICMHGAELCVLMATGNTPIMDWNILEGMRTLSATIAVEMPESEVGSSHFRILFFAALLLLMFTFAVNSLAEWVRQRLRERYRAL